MASSCSKVFKIIVSMQIGYKGFGSSALAQEIFASRTCLELQPPLPVKAPAQVPGRRPICVRPELKTSSAPKLSISCSTSPLLRHTAGGDMEM